MTILCDDLFALPLCVGRHVVRTIQLKEPTCHSEVCNAVLYVDDVLFQHLVGKHLRVVETVLIGFWVQDKSKLLNNCKRSWCTFRASWMMIIAPDCSAWLLSSLQPTWKLFESSRAGHSTTWVYTFQRQHTNYRTNMGHYECLKQSLKGLQKVLGNCA